MKTYRAIKAFPHGNSYVAAGATVNLTDKQATFLNGYIEPADTVADAPALVEAPTATPAADPNSTGGKKKETKK